ncbi:MAG: hypothetical protein B7Y45_00660 [Sphingomonas sp. 28-66-16]|nr:MAG: hypothetical protein B7Y45_00660 [Sphingomonas sp. 28-66-16]
MIRPLRGLPRWAVLLLLALLLRALTFGNPIVHVDEEFYFVTARAMVHGAVPYLDVWDRKPIGLFLLYLPAAALGLPLGIWAYQAMALASVVATAALIARLAERAGWGSGALPAACAYLLWLNLLEGEGGQTPIFYNLLMVGAASLLAPRADDADQPARRLRQGIAACALVGLALQIKYSVVFEAAFFGLWWVWREWRLSRSLVRALVLGAGLAALVALPTLAAWGWYVAHGAGAAFVYANFVSIGQRVPDPLIDQLLNLLIILLVTSPLLSMVVLTWRLPRATGPALILRRWLFAWGGVAGLGLLLFGSYFDHYALPLLVPLCAIAAGFFAEHRAARRFALPLFALLLIGSEAIVIAKLSGRGTPAQFAALTRAVGKGPGCLYVFSSTSMFYAATDRCTLTRYQFPSHLDRVRERGAIGVDQQAEIERIFAAKPAIVLVRPPFRGERLDMRALALRLLARDYKVRVALPLGNEIVTVYARRSAAPSPRRASTSP